MHDQDTPLHGGDSPLRRASLLQLASDALRMGGWEVDLTCGRVTWSDLVCDIHHVARGTTSSLEQAIAHYAPGSREQMAAAFAACASDGTPYDLELQILADGRGTWVRTVGQAARDDSGRIVRVHGAVQDISDRKAAEQALAQSERSFGQLADAMPHLVWKANGAGEIMFVNRSVLEYTGLAPGEISGDDWIGLLHPDDLERTLAVWGQAVIDRTVYSIEYRLRGGDGSYRWFRALAIPIADEQGELIWYGNSTDIHDARLAEDDLRLQRRALEACANPIAILGARAPYPVAYLNSAFMRVTGHSAADIGRDGLEPLWDAERDQPGALELRAALAAQREGRAVIRARRRDGGMLWLDAYLSPVPDADGQVSHFVAAMYDITAARQYQAELEYQSNYDALTGLANRNLLRDRTEQAIRRAAGADGQVWLAYINLDRFKAINDALGHEAGDEVLRAVAGRLQAALRPADTAARIASDEFVALLGDGRDKHAVTAQVDAIRQAIGEPLNVDGHDCFITCSVGVAAYPSDSDSAETLINQANLARYRATQADAGFRFYTASMNDDSMERLHLENDLRHALRRDELTLHYQPQVDAASGRIVGVEALLRWQHPRLGLVRPDRFIPIAEDTGLILPIGAWVICTACLQARAWQDAGLAPVRVAVNLSARQFYQPDLADSVAAILRQCGLEPEWLEIELTEGLAIENVDQAVGIMRALKAVGVKLSIDDFGTGYSSLAHLKNFPVDVLKVDQSFVRNIASDPGEATIARTIIALGHSLGMQVIAEGVESEAQLGFLRRHRCDLLQGYYFSRPVPAPEFEVLLRENRFMTPAEAAGERRQTLLLVDDEPNVLRALERLLRGTDYQVLRAGSAEEGFDLLAQHEVQVILSDHMMPEMTGIEFLARVKQLYPHTIRMMLSGYTSVDTIIDATNSGAVFRFHAKPWDGPALRESVRDAFRYYWSARPAQAGPPDEG